MQALAVFPERRKVELIDVLRPDLQRPTDSAESARSGSLRDGQGDQLFRIRASTHRFVLTGLRTKIGSHERLK